MIARRNLSLLALLSTTLLATTAALAAPSRSAFSPALFQDDATWGDGRAEMNVYDATEVRYGLVRPAEVTHIVVRESFTRDRPVKADDWRQAGTYPVIKLNQVITVPTGTYVYHQMHSTFWRVDDGRLVSWSLSLLDSCGNTYKRTTLPSPSRLRYRALTYWEGMDDVDRLADLPANALFLDELPVRLRMLRFGHVDSLPIRLFPTTIHSKADSLQHVPATLSIPPTPAGGAWTVSLSHPAGTDTLRFAEAPPHTLLSWHRADGSHLTLRQTLRLDYWNHNSPTSSLPPPLP